MRTWKLDDWDLALSGLAAVGDEVIYTALYLGATRTFHLCVASRDENMALLVAADGGAMRLNYPLDTSHMEPRWSTSTP